MAISHDDVQRIAHAVAATLRGAASPATPELAPALGPAPVSSWRAVAAACGVSEDSVLRWRRKKGDATPPVFADAEAARAWWRGVRHGVAVAPARDRRPRLPGPVPRGQGTTLADLESRQGRVRK